MNAKGGWRRSLVQSPYNAEGAAGEAAKSLGDWACQQPGTREEQREALMELLLMTGLAAPEQVREQVREPAEEPPAEKSPEKDPAGTKAGRARVVIAGRVQQWRDSEELQLRYSLGAYTGMNGDEWRAWKRNSAVSPGLADMWGGEGQAPVD